MARKFFTAEKGFRSVGENTNVGVHYLFGSGAPGSQTQENDAEVGSLYNETVNGNIYRKKSAGSGTDKWSRLASIEDITGISWRSEQVAALTSTAAPVEGGTIDLATPLGGDEAPALVGADFTEGEFILFGYGATEVLGKIGDITGEVLTITYIDFDALAANDTFIVRNYLPDSPDAQEKQAIVTYNGSTYIKVGDVNWDMATGINLSSGYAAASGNPASGDSVEAGIQKIDGNVDAINSSLGTAQGATNFGSFTGAVLTANQTAKQLFQAIGTAIDNLVTLTGVALNAVNLGTFTGVTIPDDRTIKQALQSLETHAERGFLEKKLDTVTTAQTLDEVLVDDAYVVEWTVYYELAGTPSQRVCEKILAMHNGTTSADATTSDDTGFAILALGSDFNRVYTVDLNGSSTAQTMRLRISASSAINVKSERRIIKAA